MKTGKTLLFVSGILIIVDAVLSTIGLIISISSLIAAGVSAGGEEGIAIGAVAIIGLLVAGCCILFDVFAGYYGIQSYRKGDETSIKRAYVFGIIILVLTVLSVLGMFSSNASVFGWFSNFYGLAVSVLYIVGAFMVKNASKDQNQKSQNEK